MYNIKDLSDEAQQLAFILAFLPKRKIKKNRLLRILPSGEAWTESFKELEEKGWWRYNETSGVYKLAFDVKNKIKEQLPQEPPRALLDFPSAISQFFAYVNQSYDIREEFSWEDMVWFSKVGDILASTYPYDKQNIIELILAITQPSLEYLGDEEKFYHYILLHHELLKERYLFQPNQAILKHKLANSYAKLLDIPYTKEQLATQGLVDKAVDECHKLALELEASYPNEIAFKKTILHSYQHVFQVDSNSSRGESEDRQKYLEVVEEFIEKYPECTNCKEELLKLYSRAHKVTDRHLSYSEELKLVKRFYNTAKAFHKAHPEDFNLKALLAQALVELGSVYRYENSNEIRKLAIPVYQEAIALSEELAQTAPKFYIRNKFQSNADAYNNVLEELKAF